MAIRALASAPRPAGAALLAASRDRIWRIRVGDYRVLYEIHPDRVLVLIVRIANRRESYRGRLISEESAPYATDRSLPHGGRSWTRQMLYHDRSL
jgi:hypothetical protein